MPDSNPLQPCQRFGNGRFALVRALGRGGMGEVWLAQDERLQEQVALKFLPPEIRGDAAALDELRRETVRSHKLTHPNIVRIHDLHEETNGTAFIIMEYVDGPTLAALRLRQPVHVFDWNYLRPMVEQLCAALDYAHGEKVIHRDLKPANMMVDSRGRLKLADFGIAAAASDSISRVSAPGPTSGTLIYMSPQQLSGKRAQVTDDIYALGATLYELLTSEPPFRSGDITHQVLHVAPEPIEERLAALGIANEVPGDVRAMIMACLAKEPEQRPQSATAVAGWIGLEVVKKPSAKDLFPGAPEVAVAPPPRSRKKPLWVAGALVALALLAAGGHFLAKHTSAKPASPVEPTVWRPLNIADACNADIITTAERKSSDTLTFNGGNLASSSWLRKNGYTERGIPDDRRVAIPESAEGNFFQLETPPAKNAILISGPDGSHPQPVTVELAGGDRRHYSEISVLHLTEWCGSGLLRVTLGYETGAETTAWLKIFDASSIARPVPLASDTTVAAVTIDVRILNLDRPEDLLAQRIAVDSQQILRSITFSFESLISPPRNVSNQISRQRTITAIFAISALPAPDSPSERASNPPATSSAENIQTASPAPGSTPPDGWMTLFDGNSADAWVGDGSSAFPDGSWKVEDGVLMNIPDGPKTTLRTRETFRNFELQFEWRMGYGGNSGVFYSGNDTGKNREFQLIDEDPSHFPDGGAPTDAVEETGALWAVLAPSRTKRLHPIGEWNQGRLLVNGSHVEHWINGQKVVAYELGSAELEQKIENSPLRYFKTHVKPSYAQPCDTPIGLQDMEGAVSFRNIRIRRLAGAQ